MRNLQFNEGKRHGKYIIEEKFIPIAQPPPPSKKGKRGEKAKNTFESR